MFPRSSRSAAPSRGEAVERAEAVAMCPPRTPSPELDEAWVTAEKRGICLHCRGELGTFANSVEGPFCCRGCRSVFELIHGSGLARYYELHDGRRAPAPTLRSESFAWLDRLLAEEGMDSADRAFRLSLDIQGVHCAACVWLLEELFRRQPGGLDLVINPTLGKVDLAWDPRRGDLRQYVSEVEKFGYRLGPSRKRSSAASSGLLWRLAVTVALALNVMMFSVSYYFGLAPEDGAIFRFFGVLNLTFATVAVIVGGQVFFRGAIAGLKRRVAHLDLPIAVGIALAWTGSVLAYWRDGPLGAYFDSLTLFIALMLVGRWAQEQILERNRNALLDTEGADCLVVRRLRGQAIETVPVPEIVAGDELWIAPGDLVPVAGLLLRKPAQVSLDWITGESEPLRQEPGDQIPAGAFNSGESGFTITAVEDFAASRLNDLLRSHGGRADSYRPRWWTWVGAGYVTAVLGLASIGFLFWAGSDMRRALEVTVAILVVTCPCALGLATPLAQELLHHALRARGIFLRRAGFLDRAVAVRKVLFDKTGTLTLGELELDEPSRERLWHLGQEERRVLGNLCLRSSHPVSRALAAALSSDVDRSSDSFGADLDGDRPAVDQASESVREYAGRGLEWVHGGKSYRLGSPEFARCAGGLLETEEQDPAPSRLRTVLTVDGRILAEFGFVELFKPDAAQEIARLRASGCDLYLLSGDAPDKVQAAGRLLGIESDRAHGGLDPEAKAALVRELDRADTLMVGDGLNDSPSFEAALCTATPAVDRPVMPGKADLYFLGDGVAALRRSLVAARRLRSILRDNLMLAAAYNLAAVGLSLAGVVTPVVAAVLMPASSIAIVSLTVFRLSGRRLQWMS